MWARCARQGSHADGPVRRPMSSTTEGRPTCLSRPKHRPVQQGFGRLPSRLREAELEALRHRIAETRWPHKELVDDRTQGVQSATIRKLADYWASALRLAQLRGETERAAAVQDRDRRSRHSLHPREVAAPGRVATDLDPWLARLGHRAARDRRSTHRPDRARRTGRGRVRPRAAVAARLRLLRRADRARLGSRPDRAGLGGADAPPRLHPLCRPGWRRRRLGHRRDGSPGTRRAGRHPHQLARDGARRRPTPRTEEERAALEALATFRASGFGYFLEQATRPQTIGYALLDSPVALAAWMLDHDTDSYQKISRAFVDGQPVGQSHPGPHRRQHHAVLADGHRRLGGPLVLGERTSPGRRGRPGSAGRSRFPSASPRSPARSSGPRAAGSSSPTPTSPTSMRSTRAATSPPGRSRNSSQGGPRRVPVASVADRFERPHRS